MSYYPPVGFHFKVQVNDLGPNDHDIRFTEVGGLSREMATEEIAEGGENRFIQKYPLRAKYPELVLKRGLLLNSAVWDWMRECIEDYQITPKNVDVILLNENHDPLMTWHLANAYPTKWSITDLNANSNTVVIETLQLYYQYFTVNKSS
ncbi:phage tail protein [Viridibacterium curvum]|uniref:Glycerol acyltransferase n=1 Tax=Viridibacterium curvum TaxID=1101404 RepID=A0ABP9QUK1_9RHOO